MSLLSSSSSSSSMSSSVDSEEVSSSHHDDLKLRLGNKKKYKKRNSDCHPKREKQGHNKRHREEKSSTMDSHSHSSSKESDQDDDKVKSSSNRHRKHKKRKRSRHEDDDEYDNRDNHKKKSKKRKREKKKSKEKKSKKKKSSISIVDKDDAAPVFGKYGIIKLSDLPSKQRSFEMWLEQVKKLPGFNGPKWEMQNYFKEYAEDYNTATLPHIKYYDYDKWEMDEYQRNKAQTESSATSVATTGTSIEAAFLREQKEMAKSKRAEDFVAVRSMMNKEKIEEMKRQKQLQSEMAHAFKMGDQQRYHQLKKRLEQEK